MVIFVEPTTMKNEKNDSTGLQPMLFPIYCPRKWSKLQSGPIPE
jgi:hypothetical protein